MQIIVVTHVQHVWPMHYGGFGLGGGSCGFGGGGGGAGLDSPFRSNYNEKRHY